MRWGQLVWLALSAQSLVVPHRSAPTRVIRRARTDNDEPSRAGRVAEDEPRAPGRRRIALLGVAALALPSLEKAVRVFASGKAIEVAEKAAITIDESRGRRSGRDGGRLDGGGRDGELGELAGLAGEGVGGEVGERVGGTLGADAGVIAGEALGLAEAGVAGPAAPAAVALTDAALETAEGRRVVRRLGRLFGKGAGVVVGESSGGKAGENAGAALAPLRVEGEASAPAAKARKRSRE